MELSSLILAVLAVTFCVAAVRAEDEEPLAVQEDLDERAMSPLMKMAMELRSKKTGPKAASPSLIKMAMDIRNKQAVAGATTAYYAPSAGSTSAAPVTTAPSSSTAKPVTTTAAPAPATTAAPAPSSTAAPAPGTTSAHTAAPGPAPGPAQKPNIIVFVADDLGRADISYTQGNLQVPTPDIDRLAWDGIILNRHYSNPICTPTRGAFMTGKYVFHIGMQTQAIGEAEPWGMPLDHPTQADLFRSIGYSTWHLGKWHLGAATRQYLPNGRGFDYTLGVTGGACNWFNYTIGWITPVPTSGRDLRENGKEVYANITNNVYFPELINNAAERLIRDQDPKKPFYLYFATPVAHSGFEPYFGAQHTMPQFQLRPPVYQFSSLFPERKKCLGIIQVLNEQFKRLTEAVVNKGIANNTIIIFFADNGGPLARHAAYVHGSNHASNWPLRMGKGSLFEGGVRVPGFIWSPLLKKRGRVTNQLFHVTDWLPTLWEAVGADPALLPANGDGFSHWKSFQAGLTVGPRKELVNNIDSILHQYAMIHEDQYGGLYKLIGGNAFDNSYFGWDRTEGTFAGDDSWRVYTPAEINCNFPEGIEVSKCLPNKADCLFDLLNDPCELNNIADSYPAMLKLLQDKIKAYNATSVPALIKPQDPAGLEAEWGGWWVPWLDPEPLDKVPLTYTPFQDSTNF